MGDKSMEMITNYTAEEEQLVIQSALKKKEQTILEEQLANKHFELRNESIQQYFQRLSGFHKKNCFMKFVDKLKNPGTTFQILSNMSLSHLKMESYSIVDPKTDNIHHKLTLDHDRMLEKEVIIETMNNDVAWFKNLDDDKQFKLVMGLIKLCSCGFKRTLYMPLHKIYSTSITKFMKLNYVGQSAMDALNKINIDNLEDDPEFDPKHPSSIEVYKQRKKWFELIEQYKTEVTNVLSHESSKPNLDKNGKGDKNDKNGKGNKKRKLIFKEKDKQQAKIDCELDLIQLLPIWIVKKILNYCTNEQLLEFKNVNNYWSLVSQEIIKERKTREKIDELLENMKSNINPKVFAKHKIPTLLPNEELKSKIKRKIKSKNLGRHYEEVAVNKKILPKKLKNLCSVSLATQARHSKTSADALDTGEMVPFPRIIKKGLELYKYRPCSLQDVGVSFNVDEDIEKQKSFITYSLSSAISSIKISVDQDMLTDW